MEHRTEIDYSDVPGFPIDQSITRRELPGHLGRRPAVIMSGRFHFYEGYLRSSCSSASCRFGVKTLIVTNAAGGVNLNYRAWRHHGDLDHIKLEGASPMTVQFRRIGGRFFMYQHFIHLSAPIGFNSFNPGTAPQVT